MKAKKQPSYRDLFEEMPALAHDRKMPDKSPVILHIRETLQCDVTRAVKVFHLIRDVRRRIVVFDMSTMLWSGIKLRDPASDAKRLFGKVRGLEMRVAELELVQADLLNFMTDTIRRRKK